MGTNGRQHNVKKRMKRRKRQQEKRDRDAMLLWLSQKEAENVVERARSILLMSLPQIAEMTVEAVVKKKNMRAGQEMLKGLKVYAGKGEPLEMRYDPFKNRTEEELLHYAKTGRWPEEKKKKEPYLEDWR